MIGRHASRALLIASLLVLLVPGAAQADFGFLPGADGFQVTASEEDGSLARTAGSHPAQITTEINFKLAPESPDEPDVQFTDGDLKDLHIDLPPGLIENPTAVPQCGATCSSDAAGLALRRSRSGESCPDKTQIGTVTIQSSYVGGGKPAPSASSTWRRRRVRRRSSASLPTARRSRSLLASAKPAANTASPSTFSTSPSNSTSTASSSRSGATPGHRPRRRARQLPERGRPRLSPGQVLGRPNSTRRTRPGLPDPAEHLRRGRCPSTSRHLLAAAARGAALLDQRRRRSPSATNSPSTRSRAACSRPTAPARRAAMTSPSTAQRAAARTRSPAPPPRPRRRSSRCPRG